MVLLRGSEWVHVCFSNNSFCDIRRAVMWSRLAVEHSGLLCSQVPHSSVLIIICFKPKHPVSKAVRVVKFRKYESININQNPSAKLKMPCFLTAESVTLSVGLPVKNLVGNFSQRLLCEFSIMALHSTEVF